MHIKSLVTATAAAAASLVLAAGPALAGNGHFIASATTATLSAPNVVVKFKEAGLESGAVQTIVASAHLDMTVQCINKGNHNPDDPKKTTLSGDFSQSGEFKAGKNGNLVGSLTISAPTAASVLSCPGGQTATITAVSWSEVSVTDLDTGAFLEIPGTFSAGSPVD